MQPPSPAESKTPSLQRQLILSHVAVISLALGLVLLMSSVFLRRYERTAETERLQQLAVPLVAEANIASRDRIVGSESVGRRVSIAAIDAQAAALDLRLLVFDSDGTVRYDSDESSSLQGQTLANLAPVIQEVISRSLIDQTVTSQFVDSPDDELANQDILVAAGPTGAIQPQRAIAIVGDVGQVPILRLFLPRLLLVSGISLVAASVAGYLLSKRIAQPIQDLTSAVDSMTTGQLDQVVAASGPFEISQLVNSFNTMSRQVASSSKSQRDLLSNVAHELRTPLTSIQGYAIAVRDGVVPPGPEQYHALDTITRESERMSALIVQLLDLARLESGQMILEPERIEMAPLFDRVVARFRQEAQVAGVSLIVDVQPSVSTWGEEQRLMQLFSNLVDNAIRCTPSGGIVTIAAASLSGASDVSPQWVRCVVRDTGKGMPQEMLPVIFERFSRATETSSNGFGIGLAIVREIVHYHGGIIWVQSAPNVGTTFTIDLPIPPI